MTKAPPPPPPPPPPPQGFTRTPQGLVRTADPKPPTNWFWLFIAFMFGMSVGMASVKDCIP